MRAGNQDVCYPSLETISKDTGISLSTVKRAIPSTGKERVSEQNKSKKI